MWGEEREGSGTGGGHTAGEGVDACGREWDVREVVFHLQ